MAAAAWPLLALLALPALLALGPWARPVRGEPSEATLDAATRLLRGARRVVALTGAGVSIGAGIEEAAE